MFTLTAVTLLFNGLMLMLALGSLFVFVIFLQDAYRDVNTYFIAFMLAMVVWMSGSFIGRATAQVAADEDLTRLGLFLLEVGLGGACISVYILAATLTESRGTFFWATIAAVVTILSLYGAILLIFDVPLVRYTISPDGNLSYNFTLINGFVYFMLSMGILLIVWRNLPKIKLPAMSFGLLIFALGQIVSLLSPRLRSLSVAENTGSFAAVFITYAIVQSQVVEPLLGRTRQVEVVRDVGLAITSQVRIDRVLQSIAAQAVNLLQVDAAAIYLRDGQLLTLKAVHGLPDEFVGTTLKLGEGVVGTVAANREGRMINHYHREWKDVADMPLAFETFGALVCVPLLFFEDVVGVLLVIEGRDGRLFDYEDMKLLELLAPQAAVAITNSHLFEQERALTNDLASANIQLETVLTSTTNPVIAIDRQLKIIFANPAAVALASPESLFRNITGRSLLEFVSRDVLPSDLRALLRDLGRSNSHTYEINLHDRDYFCQVARLETYKRGWVVILNDITSLKEVDRLKTQLMGLTSHNLKTPLFAVMNYLDLVRDDGEAVFTDDMNRNMEAISTQLDRMKRLVEGVLDLEKVEGGRQAAELCDIQEIIELAAATIRDLAGNEGLTLKTRFDEGLPPIIGDPQLLDQAIANLLENAVKFTPSGGTIGIRAQLHADSIMVVVEDTGIGIPREAQEQVFDRFFRVQHGRSRDDISSGLGLSLVKAIVDSHKGQIWLRSEEGQGSAFYITLPVAKSPESPST